MELTKKEEEALKQFKARVADQVKDFNWYKRSDAWLIRWLRARDLDVTKAEDMFRKSQAWRLTEQMDTVMEWKVPELLDREFPMKAPGFDNDGCVIAIVPFGKWDVRKAVALGMKRELLRYIDQIFENAMKFLESRSSPDRVHTQFVLILDFEDFSLKQMASKETIELVADMIRRFEANQPETLKSGWVVNAPKIFEILFALIKPLLTARTLSKVNVYGCNTENWRAALLRNIEPNQLPSQYGGSITTVRDYKISYGYDIVSEIPTFPEGEIITVEVGAGLKHLVQFFLGRGSKLSWNFTTLDYDIGFSVLFEEDTTERTETELFSCARADSHLHLQKGEINVENVGSYVLVFDNSFSRFRPKTLSYAVRVSSL